MAVNEKLMASWLNEWWIAAASDSVDEFTQEHAASLLADLRSDTRRLKRCFAALPMGEVLFARLQTVLFAEDPCHDGPYLVPLRQLASSEALLTLTRDAMTRGNLAPSGPIELIPGPVPVDDLDATAPLFEQLGDTFANPNWLGPKPLTAIALLREPLHRLAASYTVANYVLTPLLGVGMFERDPYAPLLRLWMLGATPLRCSGRLGDGVRVYLEHGSSDSPVTAAHSRER